MEEEDEKYTKKLIGINQASREELERIPRIGPATSERICELRPFHKWSNVSNVKGIGEAVIASLKAQIYLNFPPKSLYENEDGVIEDFDEQENKEAASHSFKIGQRCVLKKQKLSVKVCKIYSQFIEVQFKDGSAAIYHWSELKYQSIKKNPEAEGASKWRDFMFTQFMWGEDAAQLWRDDSEKEGDIDESLDEIESWDEEEIEEEIFSQDYDQISRNGKDVQVEPYQLRVVPDPKRFPHIGRVSVSIDWLQILGLPLMKRVGDREIEFEYAWPGIEGDERSGTGALINGGPGFYQWVMTSGHLVFPAMRISTLDNVIREVTETEAKLHKEIQEGVGSERIRGIKSILVEAVIDVKDRLKQFRATLKDKSGDWFKIENCPMKVEFAHNCHGNLARTAQAVKSWKIYDHFKGRHGLGDDYQADPVGAVKTYRGQDIAVMKLERPVSLVEEPFSLLTVQGSEEELQNGFPAVEIYGYVTEEKGHVSVDHGDGRKLKYPRSNTYMRGHASKCVQTQHRFSRNSLDVKSDFQPYVLQFRGEFNVGHSGAVGFVECGSKRIGVGVLSGPNLSRDKHEGHESYVDSILTGFSTPVVDWLQKTIPKAAMPPTETVHISELSKIVSEQKNSTEENESSDKEGVLRSNEDDMWEITKLTNVTLKKRKRTNTSQPINWDGSTVSGAMKPGTNNRKRTLEEATLPPSKRSKMEEIPDCKT